MPKPRNAKLYAWVKKYADRIYKKTSAYKSGFIVRRYKSLCGTYEDDGKPRNLARWYKEKWEDVAKIGYPVYRPTRRISKKTPLTKKEIDPKNFRAQAKLKQSYRGDKNLPAFKAKAKQKKRQ